jgi:hypothetical protein
MKDPASRAVIIKPAFRCIIYLPDPLEFCPLFFLVASGKLD